MLAVGNKMETGRKKEQARKVSGPSLSLSLSPGVLPRGNGQVEGAEWHLLRICRGHAPLFLASGWRRVTLVVQDPPGRPWAASLGPPILPSWRTWEPVR